MKVDCKLQVWDGLFWQQKFLTFYLDLWRSHVLNGKVQEESEERKQYMVKWYWLGCKCQCCGRNCGNMLIPG